MDINVCATMLLLISSTLTTFLSQLQRISKWTGPLLSVFLVALSAPLVHARPLPPATPPPPPSPSREAAPTSVNWWPYSTIVWWPPASSSSSLTMSTDGLSSTATSGAQPTNTERSSAHAGKGFRFILLLPLLILAVILLTLAIFLLCRRRLRSAIVPGEDEQEIDVFPESVKKFSSDGQPPGRWVRLSAKSVEDGQEEKDRLTCSASSSSRTSPRLSLGKVVSRKSSAGSTASAETVVVAPPDTPKTPLLSTVQTPSVPPSPTKTIPRGPRPLPTSPVKVHLHAPISSSRAALGRSPGTQLVGRPEDDGEIVEGIKRLLYGPSNAVNTGLSPFRFIKTQPSTSSPADQ